MKQNKAITASQAKKLVWPTLTGTYKQRRWAQDIRNGIVQWAYTERPEIIPTLIMQADASWWIDNRNIS
jgi:hypothetical protein